MNILFLSTNYLFLLLIYLDYTYLNIICHVGFIHINLLLQYPINVFNIIITPPSNEN